MAKNGIRIEAPRGIGREIELFLQKSPARYPACAAHIHNAVELLYIHEGSFSVTLDGICYEVTAGDLILFRSNAIHHVTAGEAMQNSYFVLKIPPFFFMGLAAREIAVRYSLYFALNRKDSKCLWKKSELEGSKIKRVLADLIDEYTHQRYAFEVATKLKIMELLLTILRSDDGDEAPVTDPAAEPIYAVISYIREHYAQDMDERELSQSFGMSYSYFSRSFKRVTGVTFKSYLNRTRIARAEQLLLEKRGSVSEVATACGYNNVSYFISVYRALTGKTPGKAMRPLL